MALLKLERLRRGTWIPLLAMALSGGGCMLLARLAPRERALAFDHARHVEEGLECADCHAGAADSDAPGMPRQEQCMLCHQDLDQEKPPEKQVASLFAGAEFKALHAARLPSESIFSHRRHVAAGAACTECHRGIESSSRIEAK